MSSRTTDKHTSSLDHGLERSSWGRCTLPGGQVDPCNVGMAVKINVALGDKVVGTQTVIATLTNKEK